MKKLTYYEEFMYPVEIRKWNKKHKGIMYIWQEKNKDDIYVRIPKGTKG